MQFGCKFTVWWVFVRPTSSAPNHNCGQLLGFLLLADSQKQCPHKNWAFVCKYGSLEFSPVLPSKVLVFPESFRRSYFNDLAYIKY